jgi:hypothetical protein
MDAAVKDTATFPGLPRAAARMLAVEILLADFTDRSRGVAALTC